MLIRKPFSEVAINQMFGLDQTSQPWKKENNGRIRNCVLIDNGVELRHYEGLVPLDWMVWVQDEEYVP